MALGIYYNKIPIYPILYLLKGDYMLKRIELKFFNSIQDAGRAKLTCPKCPTHSIKRLLQVPGFLLKYVFRAYIGIMEKKMETMIMKLYRVLKYYQT